jgi:DNA-binding response OmpR family regulator
VTATILVVEDDPDILVLTRVALQRAGLGVVTATSAEAALELLDREWPDMVFLDIRLPGIDGWEFLDRIREREEGDALPVVMMSAHTSPETLAKGEEVAAGYLVKPFRATELVGWVDRVLPGWRDT